MYCLEILSSPDKAEWLGALLAQRVAQGWEEEEGPEYLLARIYAPQPEYCRELAEFLRAFSSDWSFHFSTRHDCDWLTAWKKFFTPVRAGRRFLVLPPWREPRGKPRRVIYIEPKTAFGTGQHASTALCLRALSDLADAGYAQPGRRFLDLGTGSGILGLGAALLGLSGIGVDTDPLAVDNALENRGLNKLSAASFELRLGSLEAVPERGFDLIMANILAEPLRDLAEELVKRLGTKGLLILSGILRSQVYGSAGVVEAYSRAGLKKLRLLRSGEWAALLMARSEAG